MIATHQQYLALCDSLPADARELLEKVLNGEAIYGHIAALYVLLRTAELKAQALLCLHHERAPIDLLQMCIRHFWKVDSRSILNSQCFTLQSAREMFKQARFPSPPGLTRPIQVWRGTAGKSQEEAHEGLCWTLDRDVACWFAVLREGGKAGTPLVITAHVQPDQILFSDDERDGTYEQEVILDRIENAEVDGTEPEWRMRAKHFAELRNARQRREPLA